MIKHRIFLAWLLYLVIVTLIALGLCYLGIPQLAIAADHSNLTLALLGLYMMAEGLAGWQAWRISCAVDGIDAMEQWLRTHTLTGLHGYSDGALMLRSYTEFHMVAASPAGQHLNGLQDMAKGVQPVDQAALLDVLSDRLYAPLSLIEFIAGRIVWVGILATILGVILAFWPLLGSGMAVEAIRAKLGGFFSGIAVAFIPTASSFVFKIALDASGKILNGGIGIVINRLTYLSATRILPLLARVS